MVQTSWNVMAHAQKPDFVFRRNGQVHLNRQGCQFSRLLSAEVCASAVVMLDTPRSEVVWRVLATHSIRQFPLHFRSPASPCAITFQLESTSGLCSSAEPQWLCYDALPTATYFLILTWARVQIYVDTQKSHARGNSLKTADIMWLSSKSKSVLNVGLL